MPRATSFVFIAMLTTVPGAFARAADIFPPSWRGQPGSTSQAWEFFTPTLPSAPDLFSNNPYGTPMLSAVNANAFDPGWGANVQSQVGVFGIDQSSLRFDIPNNPPLNPYKDIRVQITWGTGAGINPNDNFDAPTITIGSATPLSNIIALGDGFQSGALTGEFHFAHSYFDFRIFPNPASEYILVSSNPSFAMFGLIDSVVIDTICVPSPGIAGLLLPLLLLGRRSVRGNIR